jgi:hypothetical protein
MSVLSKALKPLMISEVPSYANKFFYSLGFLSMISFVILIITGVVMSFFGTDWWLTDTIGKYFRSVHMWATQAFVVFIILHLMVVFVTSAFKKPRRLTWVLGATMLAFVMLEAEFGYVLRGDFSSQWRSLQGADFYNGSGLGYWINALNYKQIYGIHIMIIPFMIIALLFLHYLLVRVLGIAKPYRKDIERPTVAANHSVLFTRGGGAVVLILVLALLFPSPFIKPTTISEVAIKDPSLMATTLVKEFDVSSATATYQDNIAPYTFSSKAVFIAEPYDQLIKSNASIQDQLMVFEAETSTLQTEQLKSATDFFGKWDGEQSAPNNNPAASVVESLVDMAKSGLYESSLAANNLVAKPGDNSTYVLRFLADSGVLEEKASNLKMTTDQYGMLHEESTRAPGAWWLAPIGLLNHTVLKGDVNGDRDSAIIFGTFFLVLIAYPYIPGLNQIPDKLKVYKLIWRMKK